ncbi:hypothetical protein J4214_05720 [Candidatus Woesearchaeota archaeon]|nr:hypothetical protein [Candidatus Woesearchaeota archaeon]
MKDYFLLHEMLDRINIRRIDIEDFRNKDDNSQGDLEHILILEKENKEEYERRVLNYSRPERYDRDLYVPPGIKLEHRWFRFPNLNPVGIAYMTLYKIELDQNLNGDFYRFVGIHEIGHLKNADGYDEQLNTLRSAYDFQNLTGKNYTYLPK